MKTRSKTLLAVLMLLAISCKKESNTIQSSGSNDERTTEAAIADINEVGTNTVKIGSQVWMKKNLSVTHYRNGDRIPQVKDPAKWRVLTTGAWCWYNNDSANGTVYGRLYNWYAVNDPRGLAPEGWHVPKAAEWKELAVYLGGLNAGGKMKSTGTIEAGTGLWYAPNTGATNSSGFTGLPGGMCNSYGNFSDIGSIGIWWSSGPVYNSVRAPALYSTSGYIDKPSYEMHYGLSVRCVKD